MHPAVEETVKKIKSLEVQGARNIAERAVASVYTMLLDMKNEENKETIIKEIREAVKALAGSRPTEPALREALTYILRSVSEHRDLPAGVFVEALINDLERFGQRMDEIEKRIREVGRGVIEDGYTIITHCHSSTLIGVFLEAAKEREFHVIVTETRPKLQGLKTAKELLQAGVKVTYIVDSAAYYFMKNADLYMTGADAITADGKVVNKIGTALIALAAHHFGVPYYVVASSLKFDPATVLGMKEPIEERDPSEVIDPKKLPGADIKNPAFDATPPAYVTAVISELGILNIYSFISILSSRRSVDPALEELVSIASTWREPHVSRDASSP